MSSEAKIRPWADTPPDSPAIRHFVGELVESQTWLDKLAEPIQSWLLKFFGQPGQPNRKLKDVLNGTWLGHALHPALTDVPIGSWTATMLLDFVWLSNEDEGIARGADITLLLGLLAAGGAAVTGLTDWSDQYGDERRVGLMHGLLNLTLTGLNILSYVYRLTGRRRAGIGLSAVAYGMAAFTAYLGGELSFSKGVGVNHVAFQGGSDDFVPVMNAQDLPENKLTRVDASGIPAILLKQGNRIYAIGATCTHMGGPLDEGTIREGPVVQCPWHGSCFHMSDGSVRYGPAVYAEPTFAIRVRNGKIELRRLDMA